MPRKDIVTLLQKLGLSNYEIRAYIALITKGRLTAKEVCQLTDIPYSKVHEVLKKLEERNWIENERTRPMYYYPKSPREAIENRRTDLENELKLVSEHAIKELQPIFEEREVKEKPDIWIIYGIKNILDKILDVVSKTSEELLIALPIVLNSNEINFKRLFSVILAKNIHIKVLTVEENLTHIAPIVSLNNTEIRIRDSLFGGGIISDTGETILFLNDLTSKSIFAIWSRHTLLSTIAKEYFYNLWRTATKSSK